MSANTEQLDQTDVFSMSEDELSRLDISQYLNGVEPAPKEEPQPAPVEETVEEPAKPEPTTTEDEPAVEEPKPGDKPEETEKDSEGKDKTAPDEKDKPQTDPESQTVPDHKAFYEALTKPFKANGRELHITNPEEIITLMQMGANYNAKMAALKPNRRFLKMLEQNNLLDEQQLGYLIDLHKKDPKAIAKLVQDSKFNFEEFDPDAKVDYASKHVAPSGQTIELDDIVQEFSNDPGFADMLTTVTQSWDPASQKIVGENPQILRILNQQKALGHFDLIQAEVDRLSILGKAQGLSTLQLYSQAEQALQAAGKIGAPAPQPTPAPTTLAPAPAAKPDTTAAKKAAAAPKTVVSSKPSAPVVDNLFSLSEEEFAKIDPTKFR